MSLYSLVVQLFEDSEEVEEAVSSLQRGRSGSENANAKASKEYLFCRPNEAQSEAATSQELNAF